MANSKILTSEDKMKLRQPIDEYVGKIQKQIDVLRKDGTAKVLEYQNVIDRCRITASLDCAIIF